MARLNNFYMLEPRPNGQRIFYATPHVKIFTEKKADDLEDEINDWLATLGLPIDPDNLYTIVGIDYQTSFKDEKKIEYTALVRYTHWQPQ